MDIRLAELLVKNNHKLPKYVTEELFPVYYVTSKGEAICPDCANLILTGSEELYEDINSSDLEQYKINWDNYNLYCRCGAKIESATINITPPTKLSRKKPLRKHNS